eukprot:COSAG06_NODE_7043_length_2660_cov_32.333073_3_plen_192_part_00
MLHHSLNPVREALWIESLGSFERVARGAGRLSRQRGVAARQHPAIVAVDILYERHTHGLSFGVQSVTDRPVQRLTVADLRKTGGDQQVCGCHQNRGIDAAGEVVPCVASGARTRTHIQREKLAGQISGGNVQRKAQHGQVLKPIGGVRATPLVASTAESNALLLDSSSSATTAYNRRTPLPHRAVGGIIMQ